MRYQNFRVATTVKRDVYLFIIWGSSGDGKIVKKYKLKRLIRVKSDDEGSLLQLSIPKIISTFFSSTIIETLNDEIFLLPLREMIETKKKKCPMVN